MRRSTDFGILAIGVAIGISVCLASLDPNFFHLQFAFSDQSFNAVLTKWESIGVARYRSHFPADFLFLAAYGIFGFKFGREHLPALAAQPKLAALLTWTLPFAAVADAAEDTFHLILTGTGVTTIPVIYFMSGSAASLKWFGIAVFLVCVTLSRRSHAA